MEARPDRGPGSLQAPIFGREPPPQTAVLRLCGLAHAADAQQIRNFLAQLGAPPPRVALDRTPGKAL
eukprot:4773993-Alexandrium_andersonii.AAC.1